MARPVRSRNLLPDWAPKAAAPALLAAACLLGGTSQGPIAAHNALQALGAAALLWCVLDARMEDAPPAAAPLAWLGLGLAATAALQLIPLAPDLWTRLPGREAAAAGFQALGAALPWAALSLDPEATLHGLLSLALPAALLAICLKLRWSEAFRPLRWAIPAVGLFGAVLGFMQLIDGPQSQLYFYAFANREWAVGFFSNANHHGAFMAMCLPFAAAWVAHLRVRRNIGDENRERVALVGAIALFLVLGGIAAGSLAGYGLMTISGIASLLILQGEEGRGGRAMALPAAGLALIAIVGVLAAGFYAAAAADWAVLGRAFANADAGRPAIHATTLQAAFGYGPLGAGLGAFPAAFPLHEDPARVGVTFINHAHSDVLETAFDLGIAGVVLMAGFLIWYLRAAARIWLAKGGTDEAMARAGSVAVLIVMAHSLVDYPLRTPAVAALTAIALAAMIAVRRTEARRAEPDAETASRRSLDL